MRRVLKFTVQPVLVTEIRTANVPRFLAVGTQGDDVVVWCEATVGASHLTELWAVMTGAAAPEDGAYIGTTQVGPVVVHVYRRLA